LQEHLDRAHHRRARDHRGQPADRELHFPGIRGLHRGHAALSRDLDGAAAAHAQARGPCPHSRLDIEGRGLSMAPLDFSIVFKNMTPILLTQSIILFQDTSLVYVVTLRDFMTSAATVANQELKLVEFYVFAAVVYFAICFAGSRFVNRLGPQWKR